MKNVEGRGDNENIDLSDTSNSNGLVERQIQCIRKNDYILVIQYLKEKNILINMFYKGKKIFLSICFIKEIKLTKILLIFVLI